MTKLTESELDYAIHTQRLEDCNRIPAGCDQQGHLTPRPYKPYKPSEHVAVDPSWSGQGGDTEDPPPRPGDKWRLAALYTASACVVIALLLWAARRALA